MQTLSIVKIPGRIYQEFITLRFDHIYKLEPLRDVVNTFSLPNASIYNNYTNFYVYIKDDQYSYIHVCLFVQVINAARVLASRPRSKVAQENMDVFKDAWEREVRLLTDAVDDITTIDDFLAVSGKL